MSWTPEEFLGAATPPSPTLAERVKSRVGLQEKRGMSPDEFLGIDTFARDVEKQRSDPLTIAADVAKGVGKDLLESTVAAGDMIFGAPANLMGKTMNVVTRLTAIAQKEPRAIQEQAGLLAESTIPAELKTPLQTILTAAGGEMKDQAIVEQGMKKLSSNISRMTRGALTPADVDLMLGTFMDSMGVAGLHYGVKYALAEAKPNVGLKNRASYTEPDAPGGFPQLENFSEVRPADIPRAVAPKPALERPVIEGEFTRERPQLPGQKGAADPKLLAMIAAAGGISAYLVAHPEDAGELAALGLLGVIRGKSDLGGMSAKDLVTEARKGSAQAQTEIYNREAPKLERALKNYFQGDLAKAQDVVQETMLSAFEALKKPADAPGGFRGDSEFGTWLYTNAMNKAKNVFRGQDARVKTVSNEDLLSPEGTPLEPQNGLAESPRTPEEQLRNSQLRDQIHTGLTKIRPEFRRAFEGRELEGRSIEELAKEEGVAPETISSRLFRAKEELKKILGRSDIKVAGLGAAAYLADPEHAKENALLGAALLAIKEKGGMWHPEAVEKLSRPLWEGRLGPINGEPITSATKDAHPFKIAADRMVKQWLNKHAGTATDPLKDVEIPLGEGMARWEDLTDAAITSTKAKHLQPTPDGRAGWRRKFHPGLEKVPPEESVWRVGMEEGSLDAARQRGTATQALSSYLSHVGDYLREHIPPEKLSQYDLPRAVKETKKWDEQLAKKMNDARLAEKEVSPIYKEYPNGFYWQQLTKPGQFARESDAMGHSVRGYEPPKFNPDMQAAVIHPDWIEASGDSGHPSYGLGGWEAIKRGDAKIYSLRDAKGESHATVEVGPNDMLSGDRLIESGHADVWQRFQDQMGSHEMRDSDLHTFMQRTEPELYKELTDSASILQIKGKQNRAPAAEYLPYVQDFVKGGKWGEVGDLGNTGMRDMTRQTDMSPAQRQHFEQTFGTERYVDESAFRKWYDERGWMGDKGQRGSVDPKLLLSLGGTAAGAALGAWYSDDKLLGAIIGGAAGLYLSTPGGKKVMSDVLTEAEQKVGLASTALKNRAPRIFSRVMDYERNVIKRSYNALIGGDRLFSELESMKGGMLGKMLGKDNPVAGVERAIQREDFAGVERELHRIGKPELIAHWRAVKKFIDDTGRELFLRGRIKSVRENHFPRVVKDYEGLMEKLNIESKTALEARIDAANKASLRQSGAPLSEIQKSEIINAYLREKGASSFQPNFAKNRTIREITDDLAPFYASPLDAFHTYVRGTVKDLEAAKLFGKNLRTLKKNGLEYIDYDKSIGELLAQEMQQKTMSGTEVQAVHDILRARFSGGETPAHRWMQDFKNVAAGLLLGNPLSALAQYADIYGTAAVYGLKPTLRATYLQLKGDAPIKASDLGLVNHITEEFLSSRPSKKFLDWSFAPMGTVGRVASGLGAGAALLAGEPVLAGTLGAIAAFPKKLSFGAADVLMKENRMNAALIYGRDLAKTPKGRVELQRQYEPMLGPEGFQLLVDELRGKNAKSDPVMRYIFNELSRTQPISKMESSQWALNNPNGRVAFFLKGWANKQVDYIRRASYDEIKKGDRASVKRGLKNLLYFTAFMGLGGATLDQLQNWMRGRKADFDAGAIFENALKTFALGDYTRNILKTKGPGAAAANIIAPPYRVFDDVSKLDSRIFQYIPKIGKPLYDHLMGGKEKWAAVHEKLDRKERLEESMSSEEKRIQQELRAARAKAAARRAYEQRMNRP